MELSRNLERLLTERYGSHTPALDRDASSKAPRPQYCPGCGLQLEAEVVCPERRLSLRDLQSQLVEMHPHLTNARREIAIAFPKITRWRVLKRRV